MNARETSALLVTNGDNGIVGIVTDRDFRARFAAGELDGDAPVAKIMSSPVLHIHKDASIVDAILMMVENNIKHLGISDDDGKIIAITSSKLLLLAEGQTPVAWLREIRHAKDPQTIIAMQSALPALISRLLAADAQARQLNAFITATSDAILARIITFALDALGPAPVPFCFMVMGSEGRREQTLKTDQDNALIYKDVSQDDAHTVSEYFLKLAARVCSWLNDAGYTFCGGNVMAQNPTWCQPLTVWQDTFRKWVHTPTPKAIMHSTIFFDFRSGWGEEALAAALNTTIREQLQARSDLFFYHLAENALHAPSALGAFNRFRLEDDARGGRGLNLKKAMTPIVDYGRVHALANDIPARNTLLRIEGVRDSNGIAHLEAQAIQEAYSHLMLLRLRTQAGDITHRQQPAENLIDPATLNPIERKLLKEILKMVSDLQTSVQRKFMGTV